MSSRQSDDTRDKPLFWFYIVLLVWLPLPFGANRPMYWWIAEAGFSILTITWVIQHLRSKVDITLAFRNATVVFYLALFFMVFICLQAWANIPLLNSIDVHATENQIIKSLMLFQIFGLTLLLVRNHSRVKILAWTILLAGTFQAVYGTLMTVTGTDYIWTIPKEHYKGVATGTFVNRNHFAGYLEMALAVGIGLLIANLEKTSAKTWRERLRRFADTFLGPKVRIRVCLMLMVIGLILSHSRMGNAAFFASMMIAGGLGLFLFRRSGRGVVMLFASMLIIDIFLMGSYFGIDKLQDRIEKTDVETEQRFEAARLTLEIAKDHPWTGTGLGTFYTAFPQYRNEKISLFYDHAHNDIVEFASELGIIGLTPLALIWILSLIKSIRVQRERRSQLMKAMGFASTMAMISIFIHSWTDFNLQISANAATFMVILALPYVAANVDRREAGRAA